MPGEEDLQILLKNMSPIIDDNEYVFISLKAAYGDYNHLNPICYFIEDEGLTLIIRHKTALQQGLEFEGVFKRITLNVHSSLEAVGLTAAVATRLKENNISANVVAAYYHDHIFVQSHMADKAMKCLKDIHLES